MHMLCHRTAALVRADSRRFPASDIPLRGGERYVLYAMERQRWLARPPSQPAALGHAQSRPRHRVAHHPKCGHSRERLVGILVNGSWTSWSWDDKNRRYALWEVAPEVRWYLGEREAWYLGVMGKVGHFNYKFSETGRLGDIVGGGLTGGYMLRLNDAFSLDFGLGIGYLRADYDEYVVIDNVRVRSGEGSKNWWGPIHAGVTLVWTLF